MSIYLKKFKAMKIQFSRYLCLCVAFALAGCSGGIKEQLGLDKDSPDEFAVITRAPLEMPTQIALPPPNRGAPRPQETTTIKAAKQAVFGEKPAKQQTAQTETSSGESILLQRAGTAQAEDNIRATVNVETEKLTERNKPVAEKILNITGTNKVPSATVVDSKKELERIKKAKEEGQVLTGENSASVEQ